MCSRASSPFLYDRLMAAWQVSGFEPNVIQESDSFPTTVALVASGQGISFVGREFSRHFTQAVKVKPVIDFHFDAGHDLVWRRENNLAVMKQFLDFPVMREAPLKKPKPPAGSRTGARGAMSMKIAVD
jgi:DNA-binding transcriptional LysR family regulator